MWEVVDSAFTANALPHETLLLLLSELTRPPVLRCLSDAVGADDGTARHPLAILVDALKQIAAAPYAHHRSRHALWSCLRQMFFEPAQAHGALRTRPALWPGGLQDLTQAELDQDAALRFALPEDVRVKLLHTLQQLAMHDQLLYFASICYRAHVASAQQHARVDGHAVVRPCYAALTACAPSSYMSWFCTSILACPCVQHAVTAVPIPM